MDWVTRIDWEDTFVPDTGLLEIFLRGTLVYLGLLALLRLLRKREMGGVGVADLLVLILIADAAQNAMAHDYTTVPEGILLVAVILVWATVLDWVAYRAPALRRFITPPELPLVRDGRMLRRNMAKELITEDELVAKLRQHGVDDIGVVKLAFMEQDGRISVITKTGEPTVGGEEGHPAAG